MVPRLKTKKIFSLVKISPNVIPIKGSLLFILKFYTEEVHYAIKSLFFITE